MDKITYLKWNIFFCFMLVVFSNEIIFAQKQISTLEKLTQNAEMIVTGEVTRMESSWNADETRIYTNITIAVDQFLKGEQPDHTLILQELGGEVGEVGELYTHVPKFTLNEEVVVFVKKDQNNQLRVAEGVNGKLSIITDEKTGSKTINEHQNYTKFVKKINDLVEKEQ